ncbi:probable cytochrome P450 305a1 [Schistocerca serialis cubense]|uniref:probable cytochrome P450 305a1 n=1 Tax=Schistocerca serialis cubense TaxID=2023355 RepID=UPI00214EEE2C|nr:probable cytochrome P450 305a1 [Schistocerca serialis cubense]
MPQSSLYFHVSLPAPYARSELLVFVLNFGTNLNHSEGSCKCTFNTPVMMDKEHWGGLEVYRPEHLITETGQLTEDGAPLPFALGELLSLERVMMDKEHWGGLEVYRPEHLITETGQLTEDGAPLPFALGRRRCLGEHLAKCCLFQMFAGILQKFLPVPADGTDLKSIAFWGFNLAPKPYDIIFKS